MHKQKEFLTLVGVGLILVAIVLFYLNHRTNSTLDSVETLYEKGERALTVGERREFFNQALAEYIQLENTYHPMMGTGKLYYNIANNYFQLGQYPLAIYYYKEARSLRPRDERVTLNLAMAEKNLGVAVKETEQPFRKLLFFYYDLSVPEQLQLLSFFLIVCFLALSAQIWTPKKYWKKIAFFSGLAAAILLGSLMYTYYFAPIQAIMLQGSDLYKGAGKHYARVTENPIPSGVEVEVLESLEEGQWLKVVAPDGAFGYVPSDVVKLRKL